MVLVEAVSEVEGEVVEALEEEGVVEALEEEGVVEVQDQPSVQGVKLVEATEALSEPTSPKGQGAVGPSTAACAPASP